MLAGTTNLRRLDQVEHFWDTVDTIGEGFGFSLFGARHLVTLALYIGFAALSCKLYKAADEKKRAQLRGLFAVLLLADEAFKQIGLQIGGNFNWDYLPLHLCSINIFLIALYAWKPSRLLDNFLYFSGKIKKRFSLSRAFVKQLSRDDTAAACQDRLRAPE